MPRALRILLFLAPFVLVTPHWVLSTDAASYMTAGESLAAGNGYLTLGGLWMRYPPLYPSVIAVLLYLPGNICRWLSAANALAFGVGIWLVYSYFERRSGRDRATIVTTLSGCCAACWDLIPESCTYVWILPFQMAGMLVAERCLSPRFRGARDLALLALLLTEALLLRSAAAGLVAGIAIWAVLPSRESEPGGRASAAAADQGETALPRSSDASSRRRLAVLAVCVAGFAGSVAFRAALTAVSPPPLALPDSVAEGVGYWREFKEVAFQSGDHRIATSRDYLERLAANAILISLSMAELLAPGTGGSPVALWVLISLVAVGFVQSLFSRWSVAEASTIAHLAIAISFQGTQATAYLVPVMPMLFDYVLAGVERLAGFPGARRVTRVRVGIVAMSALLSLLQIRQDDVVMARESSPDYARAAYGAVGVDFLAACEWTRATLPPDAVLTATRAPIVHYLTGRRAFSEATERDAAKVVRVMESVRTTHVLASPIHRWSRDFLIPAIAAHPGRFELLHERGTARIYRLLPGR